MPLILLLLAAVFLARFGWLLVAFAAVAAFGRIGSLLARRDDRAAADRHRTAELCAHADRQHAWTLAGDDRGVYGEFPPANM
jgi:hypothetical protein